jgi:hypothetical protein
MYEPTRELELVGDDGDEVDFGHEYGLASTSFRDLHKVNGQRRRLPGFPLLLFDPVLAPHLISLRRVCLLQRVRQLKAGGEHDVGDTSRGLPQLILPVPNRSPAGNGLSRRLLRPLRSPLNAWPFSSKPAAKLLPRDSARFHCAFIVWFDAASTDSC